MDGFNIKKWFIYVVDHHEGPFSLEDIKLMMESHSVTADSFAWTEGMEDWRAITKIPDFSSLLAQEAPKIETILHENPVQMIENEPIISPVPPTPSAGAGTDTSDSISTPLTKSLEITRDPDGPTQDTKIPTQKPPKRSYWAWIVVFLISIGALFYSLEGKLFSDTLKAASLSERTHALLLTLSDKFNFLQPYISPIAPLDDTTPDEFENLKKAARKHSAGDPPQVAIAVSKLNPTTPIFHIASNLPEGTELRIDIKGIPETLLNSISFKNTIFATINKRIATSSPLKTMDGTAIPRGEYKITVSTSTSQGIANSRPTNFTETSLSDELPKNFKILIQKTVFLGGNRDVNYTERLKEFHDKLKAKANNEIIEIKQFSATLESQLNSTVTKFNLLKRGKITPKQKKEWDKFSTEWSKMDNSLNEIFSKWDRETIQNLFYYGVLYHLTLKAAQAVDKVHSFQHTYFTGKVDSNSLEIQLGEAISSAQVSLRVLRAKIENAENILSTSTGLPNPLEM